MKTKKSQKSYRELKKIREDLDAELMSSEDFFAAYGYYPIKDEDFDWQTPLEFGNN